MSLTLPLFRVMLHAMRSPLLCIALFAVALTIPFLLRAKDEAARAVTVRVTDPSGAGIPHAEVRLGPAADGAPAKLETDDKGGLSVHLKAGEYALFVVAPGFAKDSRHIDVTAPLGDASGVQAVRVMLTIGQSGGPTPFYAEDSLVLTAGIYHSTVVLSLADFRALPHITVTAHNGHTNTDETYSGVPLAALLAKVNAPIGKELRQQALAICVVVTGADGYSALLSLAEIDPSFHPGQVLVADTRDGQPLGKSGPYELIVSEDQGPARWVHNLRSIGLR